MRRVLLLPIAIAGLVNLGIAALVVADRGGEPDTVVTLDERELWLGGEMRDDSSAVRLHWRFQPAAPSRTTAEAGLPVALGPRTLEAIGFDVSVRPGAPEAEKFYAGVPGRPAFVVFDLASEALASRIAAWQARARSELEGRDPAGAPGLDESAIAAAPARASRLVPVDAGSDAEALRLRYADRKRYVILPAVVRLRRLERAGGAGGPALVGEVGGLLPETLLVPPSSRRAVEPLRARDETRRLPPHAGGVTLAQSPWPPRYRVEIAVGRRMRPRILRVDVINPPAQPDAGTTGPT